MGGWKGGTAGAGGGKGEGRGGRRGKALLADLAQRMSREEKKEGRVREGRGQTLSQTPWQHALLPLSSNLSPPTSSKAWRYSLCRAINPSLFIKQGQGRWPCSADWCHPPPPSSGYWAVTILTPSPH